MGSLPKKATKVRKDMRRIARTTAFIGPMATTLNSEKDSERTESTCSPKKRVEI
jgi:hypothetical protein